MSSFRSEVLAYVKKEYGTVPEYPWESAPEYAVLRHPNGKWFGVIMDIRETKLGLNSERLIDVMNVKCDPFLLGTFLSREGYFPPYHMTKTGNWITVSLDGKVDIDQVKFMLDMSYEIIDKRKK